MTATPKVRQCKVCSKALQPNEGLYWVTFRDGEGRMVQFVAMCAHCLSVTAQQIVRQ